MQRLRKPEALHPRGRSRLVRLARIKEITAETWDERRAFGLATDADYQSWQGCVIVEAMGLYDAGKRGEELVYHTLCVLAALAFTPWGPGPSAGGKAMPSAVQLRRFSPKDDGGN